MDFDIFIVTFETGVSSTKQRILQVWILEGVHMSSWLCFRCGCHTRPFGGSLFWKKCWIDPKNTVNWQITGEDHRHSWRSWGFYEAKWWTCGDARTLSYSHGYKVLLRKIGRRFWSRDLHNPSCTALCSRRPGLSYVDTFGDWKVTTFHLGRPFSPGT